MLLPLAGLVGLLAAHPFWAGQLYSGHDTRLHLFRLIQLDALIDKGILFSRWAPDLVYGYGSPIFNYYASGSYYLAVLPHLLGFGLAKAYWLLFVACFVLAATGAFLWGAELKGNAFGSVLAVAIVFSPVMYINAIHRGAFAELVALAIAPYCFWLHLRFAKKRSAVDGLVLALLLGLLIFTHNITALMLLPAIVVSTIAINYWTLRTDASVFSARRLGQDMIALMLPVLFALGISSFFWFPALKESKYVEIAQLYETQGFDVEDNFLSLDSALSSPFFVPSTRRMNHVEGFTYPHSLNTVVFGFAMLGMAVSLCERRRSVERNAALAFGIAALFCHFMSLPVSTSVWRLVVPLRIMQFPWRFLTISSMFYSVPGAYGILLSYKFFGRNGRFLAVVGLSIVITAVAMFNTLWTFPSSTDVIDVDTEPDIYANIEFEKETGLLGTTSTGEYTPKSVQVMPAPEVVIDKRIDVAALPDGARLQQSSSSSLRHQLTLSTTETFTLTINTFYFPGWEATIDGNRAHIFPVAPHGLIGITVPEGKHRIEVDFRDTPIRRTASQLSWATLLLLPLGMMAMRRMSTSVPTFAAKESAFKVEAPVIILVVLAISVVLRLSLSARIEDRMSFPEPSLEGGLVNFAGELALIGIELDDEVRSGEQLSVKLYWIPLRTMTEEFSVGLVVMDENGNSILHSDKQHIGGLPTTSWWMGGYVDDRHILELPEGLPPAQYSIQVLVYRDGEPWSTLDVVDQTNSPKARIATIASFQTLRPHRSVVVDKNLVDGAQRAGEALQLLQSNVAPNRLKAGEQIFIDLIWYVQKDIQEDLQMTLDLVSSAGATTNLGTIAPVATYPTSSWKNGDMWLGKHRILIPASLASAVYQVEGRFGGGSSLQLGRVEVDTPERSFTEPFTEVSQLAMFGDIAELIGFTLIDEHIDGGAIQVVLVWHVLRETTTELKSFVHLLGPDRLYVSGSDQVLGQWQRPSTGWVTGEYIVDRHTVNAPVGNSDNPLLIVGLYDSATMQRLRTPQGLDAVVLEHSISRQLQGGELPH